MSDETARVELVEFPGGDLEVSVIDGDQIERTIVPSEHRRVVMRAIAISHWNGIDRAMNVQRAAV